MSTLFSVSGSWHESTWLFEQLAFASPGDEIVLLEDAVLALHSSVTLASFIAKCSAAQISVYAMVDDLALRGIENRYQQIQCIDYAALVERVTQHDKQVAW